MAARSSRLIWRVVLLRHSMVKAKVGLPLRTRCLFPLRFLHETFGEEFLQALPALIRHKIGFRCRILLAVGGIEDHHPRVGCALQIGILPVAHVSYSFSNGESPRRIPRELGSFGASRKRL